MSYREAAPIRGCFDKGGRRKCLLLQLSLCMRKQCLSFPLRKRRRTELLEEEVAGCHREEKSLPLVALAELNSFPGQVSYREKPTAANRFDFAVCANAKITGWTSPRGSWGPSAWIPKPVKKPQAGLDRPPDAELSCSGEKVIWEMAFTEAFISLKVTLKEAAKRGDEVPRFHSTFPVTEQANPRGNRVRGYQPLPLKQLKELKSACAQYGQTAPFTQARLESLSTEALPPGD